MTPKSIMNHQEKLIRAREACAAEWPICVSDYQAGNSDVSLEMRTALRALTDLDKPIPDPDEAWRPFLDATGLLIEHDRDLIARIKAARHLMPPEES